MSRPLEHVRILDLTRLLPGAYTTLLLADLGADVVKLEDPRGGDPTRTVPPIVGGTSVYFHLFNRDKRSITVDLRSAAAAGVLDALIPRFDVVVQNFRPRVARRLGVDAATLRARHPRLVHATVSGFGQTGPYAERAAHDINFEALSGLLTVWGAQPAVPRMLVADLGAATSAATGILAALYRRERTGVGAAVDVAIHEAALSLLLFPGARALVEGAEDQPGGLPVGGGDACYNVYETADGEFFALGAIEEKFWRTFCERIERPDLVAAQRLTGDAQARVVDEVRAVMRTRTRAEWLARFADVDICLTAVNSVAEALRDPHVVHRRVVAHARGVVHIRTPIAVVDRPTAEAWQAARDVPVRDAPELGADTDAILEEAGLDASERQRLRASGVL